MARFTSTSYGPPWNAMNGTGVTATGVDLRDGKPRYGVAVDPTVIPLGSHLRIWPNPFGYRGTFEAFDTGGAIKGKRIDFYDWRGRTQQLRWGRRTVEVEVGAKDAALSLPKVPSPLDLLPDGAPSLPNPLEGLGEVGTALGNIAELIKGFLATWLELLRKIMDPETWKDVGKIWLGILLLSIGLRRLFQVVT